MQMLQQAEIPHLIGGEAGELTALGDRYLFRTSFGQQIGMPKIANYIRDELKAKTVALIWVNNDFGKGGRDNLHQAIGRAQHQARRRRVDRVRSGGFRRRCREAQGCECRCGLCLQQRGRVRAHHARSAQAGAQRAVRRRYHAAQPEDHRAGRRCRQRRAGSCRSHGRRADPGGGGIHGKISEAVQLQTAITTASRATPPSTQSNTSPRRRSANSIARHSPRRCMD